VPREPVATEPQATFPRRARVESADGRRWDVVTSAGGTEVSCPGGVVAGAQVQDDDERVVVAFWTSPALPREVRARLVGLTFAHPAIRPRRPVLLCVPAGDSEVLVHARGRLDEPRSHLAGATCLIEGRAGIGREDLPGGDLQPRPAGPARVSVDADRNHTRKSGGPP
jgi:hypothetical protein